MQTSVRREAETDTRHEEDHGNRITRHHSGGGSGTRLYPVITRSEEPAAGVRTPMCITALNMMLAASGKILAHLDARDRRAFSTCSADGRGSVSTFQYAAQPKPEGIAQAFLIGKDL